MISAHNVLSGGFDTVTDLINALPDNSSVNTAEHAK
jgi:hypothetical protein